MSQQGGVSLTEVAEGSGLEAVPSTSCISSRSANDKSGHSSHRSVGKAGSIADSAKGAITKELLLSSLASKARRQTGEEAEHFLARLTHLTLEEKGITTIANLGACRSLQTLYLYDNSISSIQNLDACSQLRHLYLQNNALESISGLQSLCNLQKLYLDNNCIKRVEGLEACSRLEELHISRQRLPPGSVLTFDLSSLRAVAGSLSVLAASGNALVDGNELAELGRLENLDLSHNNIAAFQGINALLWGCSRLQRLDLRGNPICRDRKYRGHIIGQAMSVGTLDDKEVTATERDFVQQMANRRQRKPPHEAEDPIAASVRQLELLNARDRSGPAPFRAGKFHHKSSCPEPPNSRGATEGERGYVHVAGATPTPTGPSSARKP